MPKVISKIADTQIARNLHRALGKAGIDAKTASRRAGLGDTAARDILNGRVSAPRLSTLERLAPVLGVPLTNLLDGVAEPAIEAAIERRAATAVSEDGVPTYAKAPTARNPADAIDIARDISQVAGGRAFGLYVPDDSVAPRVMTGEVVIVHPTRPPRDGELSVVVADCGEYMVRYVRRDGGTWMVSTVVLSSLGSSRVLVKDSV